MTIVRAPRLAELAHAVSAGPTHDRTEAEKSLSENLIKQFRYSFKI